MILIPESAVKCLRGTFWVDTFSVNARVKDKLTFFFFTFLASLLLTFNSNRQVCNHESKKIKQTIDFVL